MRKRILILLVFALSTMIVGCNSLINKDKNHIIISKGDIINGLGTGADYKVSNLPKDKYNIEIYAKEYKFGELKEEHNLFENKVKIDEEDVKLGRNENDLLVYLKISKVDKESNE